jgi:Domain of unknown function (DUF4383)
MRSEVFALFCGITYLSLGLLGLHPIALAPPPPDAPPLQFTVLYGYLLDLFPVNLALSAVHLAIGAWGVAAWRRVTNPRVFSAALAIVFGAFALLGLIPGLNTLFGLLPLHGHDVWLHGGTAALAAYFAWRPELSLEHRASTMSDRREKALPVAHEQRHGHGDRRLPSATEEL